MKNNILCAIFTIIIIVLIVAIIKMNSSINKIYKEVFKDKIKKDDNALICFGTFINKLDNMSNKYYIYNTKKNNFEIIFGDGSGNAIGTYKTRKNKLIVTYNGMVLNEKTNIYELGDLELEVLQNKDCSAIYIDDIAYTKVEN